MPDITTTINIDNVSKQDVWAILADFENYPRFMDSVLNVDVDTDKAEGFLSTWTVMLNGCELIWTERDILSEPDEIRFEQTDGDIETWEGYWRITEVGSGCDITLHVVFDIGIPSLSDLLHPVGGRVIKENCIQMLESFKERFPA